MDLSWGWGALAGLWLVIACLGAWGEQEKGGAKQAWRFLGGYVLATIGVACIVALLVWVVMWIWNLG